VTLADVWPCAVSGRHGRRSQDPCTLVPPHLRQYPNTTERAALSSSRSISSSPNVRVCGCPRTRHPLGPVEVRYSEDVRVRPPCGWREGYQRLAEACFHLLELCHKNDLLLAGGFDAEWIELSKLPFSSRGERQSQDVFLPAPRYFLRAVTSAFAACLITAWTAAWTTLRSRLDTVLIQARSRTSGRPYRQAATAHQAFDSVDGANARTGSQHIRVARHCVAAASRLRSDATGGSIGRC